MRHEQQCLAKNDDDHTRLAFAPAWPTPANKGTGLAPSRVEANIRAYSSDSARCAAWTAGIDVLVALSTHTD